MNWERQHLLRGMIYDKILLMLKENLQDFWYLLRMIIDEDQQYLSDHGVVKKDDEIRMWKYP